MGDNNSSEIRVRPLGEHLLENNKDIDKLLHLVGCSRVHFGSFDQQSVHFFGEGLTEKYPGFSGKEIGLAPSKKHLERIINSFCSDENIRCFARAHIGSTSKTDCKRRKWFDDGCNPTTALYALENKESWPVFEGKTRPDLFIEGRDKIVLIEGKLTEPKTTTTTRYLASRNQMVRHIQGALNYLAVKNETKKIIAFYIVPDGFRDLEELRDRKHFKDVFKQESIQIDDEEEKRQICNCYYGATTWEKVERTLGLHFRAIIEK